MGPRNPKDPGAPRPHRIQGPHATGRVKSLHGRYTGLTHNFGMRLVAKHDQRGLTRNSYAPFDTYPLIGVKWKSNFTHVKQILFFTAVVVTHTWELDFCETRLKTLPIRAALSVKKTDRQW